MEEDMPRKKNPIKMTLREKYFLERIKTLLRNSDFIKLNVTGQDRKSGAIYIPFKDKVEGDVKGFIFFKEVDEQGVSPFFQIGYQIKYYGNKLEHVIAITAATELHKFIDQMEDQYAYAIYGDPNDPELSEYAEGGDLLENAEYQAQLMKKRLKNPIATGTLLALGIGYILGSK